MNQILSTDNKRKSKKGQVILFDEKAELEKKQKIVTEIRNKPEQRTVSSTENNYELEKKKQLSVESKHNEVMKEDVLLNQEVHNQEKNQILSTEIKQKQQKEQESVVEHQNEQKKETKAVMENIRNTETRPILPVKNNYAEEKNVDHKSKREQEYEEVTSKENKQYKPEINQKIIEEEREKVATNRVSTTEIKQNTEKKKEIEKNKKEKLLGKKKILVVFSSLMIVFALFIIGTNLKTLIKENNQKGSPMASLNKPEIEIDMSDENFCKINVKYDEGIERVRYWWNEGTNVIEKNVNGKTEYVITCEVPETETNVLKIEAIGQDGSISEVSQSFSIALKPKISLYYDTANAKIEIKLKSSKGLKRLSYNWNDEEVETIELDGTEKYMATIDVKRGANKLHITAIDIDGNTQTEEKNIVGVLEPKIEYYIEDNSKLKIKIEHDQGFKKIIIKMNDNEIIYDENYPGYSKDNTIISTFFDLQKGKMNLDITVYTLEEPEKAYTRSQYTEIQ